MGRAESAARRAIKALAAKLKEERRIVSRPKSANAKSGA